MSNKSKYPPGEGEPPLSFQEQLQREAQKLKISVKPAGEQVPVVQNPKTETAADPVEIKKPTDEQMEVSTEDTTTAYETVVAAYAAYNKAHPGTRDNGWSGADARKQGWVWLYTTPESRFACLNMEDVVPDGWVRIDKPAPTGGPPPSTMDRDIQQRDGYRDGWDYLGAGPRPGKGD